MTTHRCRILLVDDHEPMREALRTLLTSLDDVQLVGEARDGEDIKMPRMNGIEAANVIGKSWKGTVIIGL